MAFNTSALSAYVENKSKQIATQAVAGAKTAKLLIDNQAFQNEVKGSHAILKMDVDVNFQDASGCGRTASGSVTLSDKTITVKSIKDAQNICPKALYNTYFASMIASGQNPESQDLDASFIEQVIALKNSKIGEAVEVLLWQGNTALPGANLNKIDGLLKQITGASDEITITESGADVVAKLQSVYSAMPVKVRSQADFRIFIGEDLFDEYSIVLAGKNIFKPVEDMTLFGTRAVLVPTPGLNGTQKVVAARISDLHFATDMVGEETKASLKYSIETEQFYLDYNFSLGVSAVHTSQIGYADFSS